MGQKRSDYVAEARARLASLLQAAYLDAYVEENPHHDHPTWRGCDKTLSNRPIAEAVAARLLFLQRRMSLLEILKQAEGKA